MAHSDHYDRWQRDQAGEPRPISADHIARSRRILRDAEIGRGIQAEADRSNRYWSKFHFGCSKCGEQGMGHRPDCSLRPLEGRSVDLGAEDGESCQCGTRPHHPDCSDLAGFDYYEVDEDR